MNQIVMLGPGISFYGRPYYYFIRELDILNNMINYDDCGSIHNISSWYAMAH